MGIKNEVSESEFIRGFEESQYKDNYSTNGLRALYEYLEDLSEDIGEDINFDVVAIACDFNEYKDVNEYLENYNTDIDREGYDDEKDYFEAVKEEIQDKTTFIKVDDDAFIIQAY